MRWDGGAKTAGQAEEGPPKLRKILRIGLRGVRPAAAKSDQLQAEVVERSILRLWLTARYFTDSVSWVTDLAPYLPQDAAGHYEEKTTQVSTVE